MKPFVLVFFLASAFYLPAHALTERELQAAAARVDTVLLRTHLARKDPAQQELPTFPPASDAVFIRRACIDLAGRLPKADEVRQFLSDASSDKRARWVDRLLNEPAAAEVRFQIMAEGLRIKDVIAGKSQASFIQWLRQSIIQDVPYHQIMATILRAEKDTHQGLIQRDTGDFLHTGTELASAFLGADLHCAQCHDHPFNNFTQRQAIEFAGCLADSYGDGPPLPKNYLYKDGKPGDPVTPRYLPVIKNQITQPQPGATPRHQLADWFTGQQNTRFAQIGALRLWGRLFSANHRPGYFQEGAVQEISYSELFASQSCDMPPTWHGIWPQGGLDDEGPLLEVTKILGEEFVRCNYQQREFLRILARTKAYQREAFTGSTIGLLPILPRVERVAPEAIWDNWLAKRDAQSTPEATAAINLPQVPEKEHPLRLLGRGSREWADESFPVISHQLARFMMANPWIESTAEYHAKAVLEQSPNEQIEQLFLALLSRLPEPHEASVALAHLQEQPQTGTQDIAWALLNTSEYLFQQ